MAPIHLLQTSFHLPFLSISISSIRPLSFTTIPLSVLLLITLLTPLPTTTALPLLASTHLTPSRSLSPHLTIPALRPHSLVTRDVNLIKISFDLDLDFGSLSSLLGGGNGNNNASSANSNGAGSTGGGVSDSGTGSSTSSVGWLSAAASAEGTSNYTSSSSTSVCVFLGGCTSSAAATCPVLLSNDNFTDSGSSSSLCGSGSSTDSTGSGFGASFGAIDWAGLVKVVLDVAGGGSGG